MWPGLLAVCGSLLALSGSARVHAGSGRGAYRGRGAYLSNVWRGCQDDDSYAYLPLVARSPGPPRLAGCAVFPADNIWNVPVDTLPVHTSSDAYVATIGADAHVHADFGSGTWDGGPIGIPYVDVPGTQPTVTVAFDYDDESDPGPYPVPPGAPIEGGAESKGDRHVLVLDRDNCILYELYNAFPQPDGSWEAGSGAIFDLSSHALRPAGWTSADAAGLPILPGLVRYEEVAAGEIRHALRFTAPQTRRAYVWPARHYASNLTGAQYPPMGQRFRLRADFDVSGFSAEVQVILRALQTYGMILADNGSAWYISGVPDERWDNDVLHELHQVEGADFKAVDVSSLMVDPDSGQARASTCTGDLCSTAALTFTAVATTYLPIVLDSTPLATVNDFVYQLQDLDLVAIGSTAYDLVVMDYSADGTEAGEFTSAQIAALKHSPGGAKIVLAYMSIGEAEDYRFYWQAGWTPGNPAWLDAENPDWSGNYKVHFWDPGWQDIVFDYTDRLLDAGFDGAYLDIIDAYEYYAEQGRATAAQEMAGLVAAIRARARARDPDFYIFPQNAPELVGQVPDYLGSVDGIGQEDIYYGYDDDDVMTPPEVTAEMEGYLDVFKHAGKLVLTVDYATTPAHVNDAYARSLARGYVPFVTVRDLDQLTINPGHEPD